MKPAISLLFTVLFSSFIYGQRTADQKPLKRHDLIQNGQYSNQAQSSGSTVFWSEDFANGIPSGWSQAGNPSAALWEYRGPNTTPDNTVGSRGYFSGINSNPPSNDPIASSTASNGFLIFDSDYLDNGNSNSTGFGSAPAPHLGVLSTDLIDLSAANYVELKLETYARRRSSRWFIAFSTNGGQSFSDTLEILAANTLPSKDTSENAELIIENISALVANEDSVVMQFIFDGRDSLNNSAAYYYWMIDDIELRSPPANQLQFAAGNGPSNLDIDMIYNGDPNYPKYGILPLYFQQIPIQFTATIVNTGSSNQSNVGFQVEIWEDFGSGGLILVDTLQNTSCSTLNPNDTCQLSTSPWLPQGGYEYKFVWKLYSDSIIQTTSNYSDTALLFNEPFMLSLDRNQIDSYLGTKSAETDIVKIGGLYHLTKDAGIGLGYTCLSDFSLQFSNQTDPMGSIQLEIYDTAGFSLTNGFPTGSTPITSATFPLNNSMVGGTGYFPVHQSLPNITIRDSFYFFIITLIPSDSTKLIEIANDASFDQPGLSSIYQTSDGQWHNKLNQKGCEGIFLRLYTHGCGSIEENSLNMELYPNPAFQKCYVEVEQAGEYKIKIFDTLGRELLAMDRLSNSGQQMEIDLSSLASGLYKLQVQGEGQESTSTLVVQ